MGLISGTESPLAGGQGTASLNKDFGTAFGLCQGTISRPLRHWPLEGVYSALIPVITDDRILRLTQKTVGEAQRRFGHSNAPLMPKATPCGWLTIPR